MAADAAGVGELERRDGEERLPRKARGNRLRRFDEPLRVRMSGKERAERLGLSCPELRDGAEELYELLAGPDREAVRGVGDDVAVRMAIPRGPERAGSLSGMLGTPVPSEYLTVTGVDAAPACGARVRFAASADGVKVPEHISPLA